MKEILSRIKSLQVLVVGDVMLDRYLEGDVRRISPEAPVPVLTVGEEKSVAGGAANVALNAAALGAKDEVFGWFGQDPTGDQLIHLLEEEEGQRPRRVSQALVLVHDAQQWLGLARPHTPSPLRQGHPVKLLKFVRLCPLGAELAVQEE